MGDPDKSIQKPLVPSWQQAAPSQNDDSSVATESILDRARRFLQEDAVKDSSREKKVEFLKSKGVGEADITTLLGETTEVPTATATPAPSPQPTTQTAPPPDTTEPPPPTHFSPPPEPNSHHPDHPPIVTYPEFLTKPLKPPPLITATGLLNALTAIAAASTLVYGATKHIVSPMVTSLTQARTDVHAAANTNLAALVDKLERAVSELPPGYHLANTGAGKKALLDTDDAASNSAASSSAYDDPAELYHRDIGVQTSPPPSPKPWSSSYNAGATSTTTNTAGITSSSSPTDQAARLGKLALHVRTLATDVVHQTEALEATTGELSVLGTDLHALTYPPESYGLASSSLYGMKRSEPDDEMHRVKMSIRGVKGVLLSTRSFPPVGAR